MNPYSYGNLHFGFPASQSGRTVKTIIVVNIALFMLVHIFRRILPAVDWLGILGLVPRELFAGLRIWQLAAYIFVHLDVWHLAVNMLMLWFFGPALESRWGQKEFLTFYFFCGIGAGLCSWAAAMNSFIPVIGASGAIFGLLVAYAIMFPETTLLLFFIFPMRIKHAVYFLAGVNLLGALSSPNAGIAYFAHLGGGLFGYLYLKNETLRRKPAYWHFPDFWGYMRRKKSSASGYRRAGSADKREFSESELDELTDMILDKISRQGMGSLSRKEKKILQMHSRKK